MGRRNDIFQSFTLPENQRQKKDDGAQSNSNDFIPEKKTIDFYALLDPVNSEEDTIRMEENWQP